MTKEAPARFGNGRGKLCVAERGEEGEGEDRGGTGLACGNARQDEDASADHRGVDEAEAAGKIDVFRFVSIRGGVERPSENASRYPLRRLRRRWSIAGTPARME